MLLLFSKLITNKLCLPLSLRTAHLKGHCCCAWIEASFTWGASEELLLQLHPQITPPPFSLPHNFSTRKVKKQFTMASAKRYSRTSSNYYFFFFFSPNRRICFFSIYLFIFLLYFSFVTPCDLWYFLPFFFFFFSLLPLFFLSFLHVLTLNQFTIFLSLSIISFFRKLKAAIHNTLWPHRINTGTHTFAGNHTLQPNTPASSNSMTCHSFLKIFIYSLIRRISLNQWRLIQPPFLIYFLLLILMVLPSTQILSIKNLVYKVDRLLKNVLASTSAVWVRIKATKGSDDCCGLSNFTPHLTSTSVSSSFTAYKTGCTPVTFGYFFVAAHLCNSTLSFFFLLFSTPLSTCPSFCWRYISPSTTGGGRGGRGGHPNSSKW